MGISRLNVFIRFWAVQESLPSRINSFGIIRSPLKWVFLLGKPHGAKF